jgi:hypothetical protein
VPYLQEDPVNPPMFEAANYPGVTEPAYYAGKMNDGHPLPGPGIEILGGVYAKYINIFSTNGLCIYQDDRAGLLGHEPIYVIRVPNEIQDK